MATTYSNLRTINGQPIDIHCVDSRFTAAPGPNATFIDCGGQLLLPALVESHCHLDKTLLGLPWRPNTAGATIKSMISNERAILRETKVPIERRAGELVEQMVANGSLAIRSHIDIDPEFGLRHVEAMLRVRETYRDVVDMQFVAFPQTGMLIQPGTVELMEEALKLGVETVGGLDPAGIDGDAVAHLKTIFAMAGRHGAGVDIHLHDGGELGVWQIERIADFTEAAGLSGKVMISHAYCLGMVPLARIEVLACRLADLSISIMTAVPIDPGIPPVAFLKEHGVNVCCGSDGIRDAWSPFGNGDMLERAFLLAFRFDWATDEDLSSAFSSATDAGARAIGLKDYGIAPGHPADFIYLPAETVGDALARRPRERTVVRGGQIVAEGGAFLGSRQIG